jgi:hypothetical protein
MAQWFRSKFTYEQVTYHFTSKRSHSAKSINNGSQTLVVDNSHLALNSFSIEAKNTSVILGVIIDGIHYRPILHVCQFCIVLNSFCVECLCVLILFNADV